MAAPACLQAPARPGRRATVLPALLALLLLGACAPRQHYLRSRWNDTVQVAALDVGLGGGLHASVQATRFLGLGFGMALSIRGGIQPPRGWRDELFSPPDDEGLPWRGPGLWSQLDVALPGLFSMHRHVRSAHGFTGPTEANGWLVVPLADASDTTEDFWPDQLDPGPPGGWLDLHARGFLLLVGGHVGFSPIEFVDWLAGWVLLDPLQDDIPDDWTQEQHPGDGEDAPDEAPDQPVEAYLAEPD